MNSEKEIGIVNGWRYVVSQRQGSGLFWVCRKSLSMRDHGRREEFVDCRDKEIEANETARKHMKRVSKAVSAYWGGPAPITYTNK